MHRAPLGSQLVELPHAVVDTLPVIPGGLVPIHLLNQLLKAP
jgi:hypothetical protein